jgi:transcriptional regulator with XRE-family HTH domain
MAREALDLLCSNLPEVADELGVSVDTLRSYRTKRRAPSAETVRALAVLMRHRAKALNRLADRLARSAEPPGDL